MLISKAYAQATEAAAALPEAPSAMEAFVWNMGLVAVLVGMFYILLIRPQQKRMKEHTQMLQGLKKGDKVITGGGLVGKIHKVTEGNDEVVIDLGNDLKVTALRSTIHTGGSAMLPNKPANDAKAEKEEKPKAKAAAGKKKK